ncbi:MAG: PaaI family thioesterase [Ignavibacteriales bacterium]
MKYKILKKQPNSKMCLVCGLKNELSLKTSFYELESREVAGLFTSIDEHQSYPGRIHGGIAAAVLDETIGRASMIDDENVWGVTLELSVEYKKPLPLNEKLLAIGRITKDSKRIFEGSGEILLSNGEVAVIGHGRYLKMPLEKISDFGKDHEEWGVVIKENEPTEIDF